MTRPTTYLVRMVVFLLLVAAGVGWLAPVLWHVFLANPELNGLILLVLAAGIAWNLRQVLRLSPEVAWLDHYRVSPGRMAGAPTARLLAPMARMLNARHGGEEDDPVLDPPDSSRHDSSRRDSPKNDPPHRDTRSREPRRLTLSAGATRSMLDSLASRLDESRELSRYMTGLLIFLGLLGTFWGLLRTIGAVADVIAAMTIGSGDVVVLFDQLKAGLAKPLQGMGTAFSASLFGLAGALVLGFLDLTAGQAQNRFFNELEEWLAGLTRLSSGALADGDGSVPVYVQALLEQTAENMESLRRVLLRGEEGSAKSRQSLVMLNEQISVLADQLRDGQHVTQQLARRMADTGTEGDEVARAHLRNIELCLQRIATEAELGRTETTADLRNDLRILTRTVAALAEK